MKGSSQGPQTVAAAGRLFCAVDRNSLDLVVIVEAGSVEEAVPRLLHVIEWYQLAKWEDIYVAPCGGQVEGVLTFLGAFFLACPPRPLPPAGEGTKAIH